MGLLVTLDKLEEQVEQLLPDHDCLTVSSQGTLDLYCHAAHKVHVSLIGGIYAL